MEATLSSIAVLLGLIGTVLGVIFGRSGEDESASRRERLIAAAAVAAAAIVLFGLSVLENPPFMVGHRMGWGILIGGVLGAIAGCWASRRKSESDWGAALAQIVYPSLALFGMGLTLLVFAGYPQAVIAGFIIGAVLSTVVFRLAVTGAESIEIWGLSAVALGSAVLLAIYRFGMTEQRFWWRAPLLIMAAAIIGRVVSAGVLRSRRDFGLDALITSVITMFLIAAFAWKAFPDWSVAGVALVGIVTYAIISWLERSESFSATDAAVQALAVVAFSALAFRFLAGFGMAIGLLAVWAVSLPAISCAREQRSSGIVGAIYVGLSFVLFRLFLENYAIEVRGLDLRAHYTLVALVIGAIFPFVIYSIFPIPESKSGAWKAVSAIFSGLFAVAIPTIILILWGYRSALGFLAGTIAAQIFLLFIRSGIVQDAVKVYARSAAMTLAAQVTAALLSGFFDPFIESTRLTKIVTLAAAFAVAVIWAGISSSLVKRAPEGR